MLKNANGFIHAFYTWEKSIHLIFIFKVNFIKYHDMLLSVAIAMVYWPLFILVYFQLQVQVFLVTFALVYNLCK